MDSKRDVLAQLPRDGLIQIADRFELAVPDSQTRDGMIDSVASSKRATLAEILREPGPSLVW